MLNFKNNNEQSDTSYPIDKIRSDFPILNQKIYGKRLSFLDSAC